MNTTTQQPTVLGFLCIVDGKPRGYSAQRQSPDDVPLMTVNEHYQRLAPKTQTVRLDDGTALSTIDWNEISRRGLLERINREIMQPAGLAAFRVVETGVSPGAQVLPDRSMHSDDQHTDDVAVDRFAAALKAKMARSRAKGRAGWDSAETCSVEDLARMLIEHLGKGNAGTFEDVATFAMMLHQRDANPAVLADALQARDVTNAARELVEIEAKKYSLNAAGLFDSGAPDHRQTIAVQELLTGFDDDEAEGHWEAIMAYSDLRASDALFHAAELLSTAPVAQAGQVPKELREAVEWADHLLFECGALVQTRAPSVHVYNKAFAAIEAAKTLLAGAPAKGGE